MSDTEKIIAHIQAAASMIIAAIFVATFSILPGFSGWPYLIVAGLFMIMSALRLPERSDR